MADSDSTGPRRSNRLAGKRKRTASQDVAPPTSKVAKQSKHTSVSAGAESWKPIPPIMWDPSAFSFGKKKTELFAPPVQKKATKRKPRKKAIAKRKVSKPIFQPLVTMAEVAKPVPFSFPTAFPSFVESWDSGEKRKKTAEKSLTGFGKFTGTSDSVKRSAKKKGVALGGGNQGGLMPSSPYSSSFLPKYMDYTRARPSQMLSQLSDVMLHSAVMDKMDVTEIQFGYGIDHSGGMDLFASANNPDVQDWLMKAMADPAKHIKRAAVSDDPEMQKIGAKLINHAAQQEQRWDQVKSQPDADAIKQDMMLSDSIRKSFLSGGVNVVKSKGRRHAEQNIAREMHQADKYEFGDIEGTKIRCMSCSSSLGSNLVGSKGKHVLGKGYTSQSSVPRFEDIFSRIKSGKAHVHSGLPRRPRSNSLPAISVPSSFKTKSGKGKGAVK